MSTSFTTTAVEPEILRLLAKAQNASDRAKSVKSYGESRSLYRSKNAALDRVVILLVASRLSWGYRHDPKADPHRSWVLYVDLPTGQISFHHNPAQPKNTYTKRWDGQRHVAAQRITAAAIV